MEEVTGKNIKKITQEMIRAAQDATECDPSECDECIAKALVAVLAIVERDYVVVPR